MSEKPEADGAIARPLTEEADKSNALEGVAPQRGPLTEAELASLEKLLAEGSQGIWSSDRQWLENEWSCGHVRAIGSLDEIGDAALCAALRNLAPALLEEIRSSRAWRKEAEGLLREASDVLRIAEVEGEDHGDRCRGLAQLRVDAIRAREAIRALTSGASAASAAPK